MQKILVWVTQMNYMKKDILKNSQVSFRQLNTVLIVRATMMEKTYKSNKINCNLFVLIDILNIEL